MTNALFVIKSDGTVLRSSERLEYETYQKAVGGYIEVIPCQFNKQPWVYAYANEEGLLQNLPYNARASDMFDLNLVGDVAVVVNEKSQAIFVSKLRVATRA